MHVLLVCMCVSCVVMEVRNVGSCNYSVTSEAEWTVIHNC